MNYLSLPSLRGSCFPGVAHYAGVNCLSGWRRRAFCARESSRDESRRSGDGRSVIGVVGRRWMVCVLCKIRKHTQTDFHQLNLFFFFFSLLLSFHSHYRDNLYPSPCLAFDFLFGCFYLRFIVLNYHFPSIFISGLPPQIQ